VREAPVIGEIADGGNDLPFVASDQKAPCPTQINLGEPRQIIRHARRAELGEKLGTGL